MSLPGIAMPTTKVAQQSNRVAAKDGMTSGGGQVTEYERESLAQKAIRKDAR